MQYSIQARPFLKWAGGKGQLLPQLAEALPRQLGDEELTYVEPFVGGGAMLFFMLQKFPRIKHVVINDINKRLADAYRVVKESPDDLIARLETMDREYKRDGDEERRKEYFLLMRDRYNEEVPDRTERTALLLFLNRTCFNGLYRENSKGKFNVPFGRYANPAICNEGVIRADSELLNRFDVQIMDGDYAQTEKFADGLGHCFYYFDPPYRPISATSNFNTYVKEAFGDKQQRELAAFCRRLSKRDNCRWMLSNSDCSAKNPADTFFEDAYEGFAVQRVWASRSVNANGSRRGKLTELLIRNYSAADKKNEDNYSQLPLFYGKTY